ncbi:MAG: LPS export ABC transporter permease LptF [Pseudomonadota bacterium]
MIRQATTVFLLTLVTLTGVLWLTQALEELALLTERGQAVGLFLQFTLLSLPGLLIVIGPVALFIACIYTLNRLNGDSELIIVNASGGSPWAVVRPFMAVGALVTLFMYLSSLYLVPLSWKHLRYLITDIRADVLTSIVTPGRFTSPERGMVFHVRDRDPDGTLRGLLVHDEREASQRFTYLAERARMISQDDKTVLVMEDGSVQQKSGQSDEERDFSMVVFDRYILDISQVAGDREVPSLKPRERGMRELLFPPDDDPRWVQAPGKFRSELTERIAGPLYVLAYVAIALAALGGARSNRQNKFTGVLAAIAGVLACRLTGFAITNLSVKSPAAAYIAVAIPLLTTAIALLYAVSIANQAGLAAKLSNSVERYLTAAFETLRRHRKARLMEPQT